MRLSGAQFLQPAVDLRAYRADVGDPDAFARSEVL
jgi:hypothetical protein